MTYLTSRDIASIALSAALWSVLSAYITPIFWRATHLPFLCDTLGVISLILVLWQVRKFGAVTLTGIIATIITLALNPSAIHFFGFTTASIVFDVLARLIGYRSCLEKPMLSIISLLVVSAISTAVAGTMIGILFMNLTMFEGVSLFAVLHVTGGVIGGVIGLVLIRALSTRISIPRVEA
jgi:hypothetical protein